MYKRKLNQITIFEDPAMFGGIALNPENEWVRMAKLIPWWAFEEKYAEQFPSETGQPADSLRMALGSQIIKERYHFSDEKVVDEIAMNPYLQYFLGLSEYRQTAPFDPSMMTRFRQRLTPEMLQEVNDVIIGRKNAEVEFGAKVELSDVDGFLRIEDFRWDAFNESTTLKDSVKAYRKAYGHYPERVLADTIFRTHENVRYCKSHHIHLNGPRLGRPPKDPAVRKAELLLEWLESGERGDIERRIGIGKRTTSLGLITAKLEHTSKVMAYTSILTVNLQKRLRLLLRLFLAFLRPARVAGALCR